MKLIFQIALLLFISSSCGQSTRNNDVAYGSNSQSTKDFKKLDRLIENLEKNGMHGGFLLMQDDKILYQKSMGFANFPATYLLFGFVDSMALTTKLLIISTGDPSSLSYIRLAVLES